MCMEVIIMLQKSSDGFCSCHPLVLTVCMSIDGVLNWVPIVFGGLTGIDLYWICRCNPCIIFLCVLMTLYVACTLCWHALSVKNKEFKKNLILSFEAAWSGRFSPTVWQHYWKGDRFDSSFPWQQGPCWRPVLPFTAKNPTAHSAVCLSATSFIHTWPGRWITQCCTVVWMNHQHCWTVSYSALGPTSLIVYSWKWKITQHNGTVWSIGRTVFV